MSRVTSLRLEFVEYVPRHLEEGVLYISIVYNTAVHRCACGCGSKITTPIGPARWKVIYDGESVSLDPSIGNWSYPCQSHYWINRNQIEWAPAWSKERIAAGRARDKADRERYNLRGQATRAQPGDAQVKRISFIRRLLRHIMRR